MPISHSNLSLIAKAKANNMIIEITLTVYDIFSDIADQKLNQQRWKFRYYGDKYLEY